jgi:hypothetical protein
MVPAIVWAARPGSSHCPFVIWLRNDEVSVTDLVPPAMSARSDVDGVAKNRNADPEAMLAS